jgi:hypothetical protein
MRRSRSTAPERPDELGDPAISWSVHVTGDIIGSSGTPQSRPQHRHDAAVPVAARFLLNHDAKRGVFAGRLQ